MSLGVSWTSLLILILAVLLAVNHQRKNQDGILAFKDGLKTGFVVVVLANLLFYLFFYIIIKSDPELVTILKQQGIEFYKKVLPEDQWKDIEKSYEDFNFLLSDALKYFAKSLIGGFFIALFAAMIYKRESTRLI